MSNVLKFDIDPDIQLDESRVKDMPDNIKGNLLAVLTLKAKKENCHWTELEWSVKMVGSQPIISVKRKL